MRSQRLFHLADPEWQRTARRRGMLERIGQEAHATISGRPDGARPVFGSIMRTFAISEATFSPFGRSLPSGGLIELDDDPRFARTRLLGGHPPRAQSGLFGTVSSNLVQTGAEEP